MDERAPRFEDDRLRDGLEQARRLAAEPGFAAAVAAVAGDDEQWAAAREDPTSFLAGFDVRLPEGVEVLAHGDGRGRPVPEWEAFSVRLTNCRTYWVRKVDEQGRSAGFETVEVCRGFEIVPNPVPGGPWG